MKMMTKNAILAAALPALLFTAVPAFAQVSGQLVSTGALYDPHGSATSHRDRPSGDPTAARPHRPAFNGPHGSASDLTDRPPSDPTARHIPRATLYGRKAGDDKRQDGKPAPRPTGGLTKAGAGTLAVGNNR